MNDQELIHAEVDVDEQAAIAAKEGFPFLFSVVMAVYNAKEYVEESIESVISQSIGFEHIQLVLVDDGSVDGSGAICESYAQKHPNNIVFISKENGGVSSARNAGLDVAQGKYLNFLDSDDLWSNDSFEWALDFLAEHPDVKLAASKYIYFGYVERDHRLNYKFKETKVVDLYSEYTYPQLSSSTCFFSSDLFDDRRFNEQLSVSEDVLLVNTILIEEMKYGVIEQPVYHYRQRDTQDSAVNTMKDNVSWYLDTPKLCYQALFDLSVEKHGSVLPFIQYTIMYDLQWRIGSKMSKNMNASQVQQYHELLVGLLKNIDDHIISEQQTISIERVAYAFALKYGTTMDDILDHMAVDEEMLVSTITTDEGENRVIKLRPVSALSNILVVDRFDHQNDVVTMEGYVNTFRFRPHDLELEVFSNNHPGTTSLFITDKNKQVTPFDDDIVGKTGFTATFPTVPGQEVRLKATLSPLGTKPRVCQFRFEESSGLPEGHEEGAFRITRDELIRIGGPESVTVRRFEPPLSDEELASERKRAIAYHEAAQSEC